MRVYLPRAHTARVQYTRVPSVLVHNQQYAVRATLHLPNTEPQLTQDLGAVLAA